LFYCQANLEQKSNLSTNFFNAITHKGLNTEGLTILFTISCNSKKIDFSLFRRLAQHGLQLMAIKHMNAREK
jgi:hypothetical protein